ncbi:hypothetical protein QCO44_11925 [Selenomonas sputigena]|uniref:Uncharacterized protein n=1 Tax=Selenomonas sputigena TaxID=69823 RepID=A0ABV3X9T4_9FIRM
MKLKKILSATFAMLLLSSSLCFASVERYSISESTMKTKCTDQARSSVYVKNGSSYTEYWCTRSGKAGAEEIAAALRDGMEVYTPNRVIYSTWKSMGLVRDLGSMRVPGVDVYHFIFQAPAPVIN